MEFGNRREELAEIDRIVRSKGSALYRLVDRRRIGKPAILAQACLRHRGIYIFAPEHDERYDDEGRESII